MQLKKNIKLGKIRLNLFITVLLLSIFSLLVCFSLSANSSNNLEGEFTHIKVLDKISSKNLLIKLKNGKEFNHKDLLVKSLKCKNSEFDDNPETMAYIQTKDLTIKSKDEVFIFNGWMFSSSPSITPFDHAVYDIWLVGCY